MNKKMVAYMVGKISLIESALLLLPAVAALCYREKTVFVFFIASGIAAVIGLVCTFFFRPKDRSIYAKEGFAIVTFAWLLMSAIGALPFTLSGEIPSYIDAFFETASGLSTTGASIVTDVEALSHGILFWRSFTHWVGGMGVLVFMVAFLPNSSDRSIHVLRAEMPGPTMGKLVPRMKDTAKILYLIYIAITLLEVGLLWAGGMSFFEALLHSFGTAGTGGFGLKADSITGYNHFIQWVITIFMFLFGINFNLYYMLLIRRGKTALRSEELWTYVCMVLLCTATICINILPLYNNFADCLRLSAFQVSSLITTTGYATADFLQWPGVSRAILFILLFTGGCAGSTAGGLKLSRVIMLFKLIRREVRHLTHPRSVNAIHFEEKPVDAPTLTGVSTYFALYFASILLIFLLISFEPFGMETNFSAAVTCFNNVGPGIGLVGPTGSFAIYSPFSKIILSFAMLFGRLEIFPMLIALSPSTWKKNQ